MQPVVTRSGARRRPGFDARAVKRSAPKAQPETPGRPGRGHHPAGLPRSEQAEQAIIEATLDLFAEEGFEGVCVEAVAARAGVGKATIYRRWPNKEELLLAAFSSLKSPFPSRGRLGPRRPAGHGRDHVRGPQPTRARHAATLCCSARARSTRG